MHMPLREPGSLNFDAVRHQKRTAGEGLRFKANLHPLGLFQIFLQSVRVLKKIPSPVSHLMAVVLPYTWRDLENQGHLP